MSSGSTVKYWHFLLQPFFMLTESQSRLQKKTIHFNLKPMQFYPSKKRYISFIFAKITENFNEPFRNGCFKTGYIFCKALFALPWTSKVGLNSLMTKLLLFQSEVYPTCEIQKYGKKVFQNATFHNALFQNGPALFAQ